MNIVVNTRGEHTKPGTDGLQQSFALLIKKFPDHRFIFITDDGTFPGLPGTENLQLYHCGRKLNHPVLLRWWHFYSLPGLLKDFKADILINANGMGCSRTAIPQLLLLDDDSISSLKNPKKHSPGIFSPKKRKRNSLFSSVNQAKAILVPSLYAKNELARLFRVDVQKIITTGIPPGLGYGPITWEEKELVKTRYARGKEYFLYLGPIHPSQNIITLLKAFSLFKKRQLTNMQLLMAGKITWPGRSFEEKLGSYKFREEVQIISNLSGEDLVKLTAGAYALVSPSIQPGFAVSRLNAMTCGVPVIAVLSESEPGNEAILPAKADDAGEIANQMKLLYKDENLRSQFIEQGRELAKQYQPEKIASIIWNCIEQSVKVP